MTIRVEMLDVWSLVFAGPRLREREAQSTVRLKDISTFVAHLYRCAFLRHHPQSGTVFGFSARRISYEFLSTCSFQDPASSLSCRS